MTVNNFGEAVTNDSGLCMSKTQSGIQNFKSHTYIHKTYLIMCETNTANTGD